MKKRLFLIVGLFFFTLSSIGQSVNVITLIEETEFHDHSFDDREVTFLISKRKNPVIKYNPVSLTFSGMLFVYQKVISSQLATNCPFEDSCSEFSKKSIKKFGLLKGIALSSDRLTKCNQFMLKDLTPISLTKENKIKDPLENYRYKPY